MNLIMDRKNIAWKMLLTILFIITLWLITDAFYKRQMREQYWSEQLRTTFISALENSLDERRKENLYIASESLGERYIKNDSLKNVIVNTGNKDKEHIIPFYKYYNNIVRSPAGRLVDSITLVDRPLKADSLNMLLDSLLIKNGISGKVNVRVSVTDLSENVSTDYAKGNQYLSTSDSLFSYYIGYRCEVEVTTFASFSYLSNLPLWDWTEIFLSLLISLFFLRNRHIYEKQSADSSAYNQPQPAIGEKEKPIIALKGNMSCVYWLEDDLLFDSMNRVLKRGNEIKKLLPQASILLVGLLGADDYRMHIQGICSLLWPDGSGTAGRVHTVIGRLRTALSEMSSQIVVINENSQYQLKIPHSIEEKDSLDVM